MPPKSANKRVAPRHGPLAPEEGTATGYMKATYEAVTARENLGVIRAVGIFGVCFCFLLSASCSFRFCFPGAWRWPVSWIFWGGKGGNEGVEGVGWGVWGGSMIERCDIGKEGAFSKALGTGVLMMMFEIMDEEGSTMGERPRIQEQTVIVHG